MKTSNLTKSSPLLDTKTVRLKTNNSNIRYAELGDESKPTIILLHGVPENLQAWYAVAPKLAKNNRVLALDWPGFGGSDSLTDCKDYNPHNFALAVIEFMDALKVDNAIIMATDIALLPAFLVGLEYPERVSKLIVMDGIPFRRPQYASWELNSFTKKNSLRAKFMIKWFPRMSAQIGYHKGFYKNHSIPADVLKEFLADGSNISNQNAFMSYFQNFHEAQAYFEEQAHLLNTPVLVIWGKYDRFINVKLAHEIVEKLPNAQLEIIDKAGHYVHMDKPDELVKVATGFIE
ncbi:alpha/beta fold hydrolase [Lacinutrix jangbogonensis]|uniref:alpha/beta fold hydrolase n=1 Tax=Lacinutrix jangbogonensis TaxID=1469557 RepID=UPI00053E973A|nr:alpha/beta hydrolase [Lacinutrix jangbogonensis]